MVVKKKKKTTKTDPKKLIAMVVDEELLAKKKKNEETVAKIYKEIEENIEQDKDKWANMVKSKFTKKEINDDFFAHYETWPKRVWIGPYNSEKELDEVIKSYIVETKKDRMNRNIKNIHSIILDIE